MTASLAIVNPVASPRSRADQLGRSAPAPRQPTLDGATTALYWNEKQNGLDALRAARRQLELHFRDVRFVEMTGETGGATRYLSVDLLNRIEAEVDALVGTTADCGGCCSRLMGDMCEVERRGVPAVGYTAAGFEEDARISVTAFGVPEACPSIVPECFPTRRWPRSTRW